MPTTWFRFMFYFYNYVGLFNFKFTTVVEISKLSIIRNFLLVPAYFCFRVLVEISLRSEGVRKELLSIPNTSVFFQIFSTLCVIIYQFSAFFCILFQIRNSEKVLEFLQNCLDLEFDGQSEKYKTFERECKKSLLVLVALLTLLYFYMFVSFYNPNWQGFIYFIASKGTDIILFSFLSCTNLCFHYFIFLLDNFHDILHRTKENVSLNSKIFLSWVREYEKIFALVNKFNQTFTFLLSAAVFIAFLTIVLRVIQTIFILNRICHSQVQFSSHFKSSKKSIRILKTSLN